MVIGTRLQHTHLKEMTIIKKKPFEVFQVELRIIYGTPIVT
jgi:hypothetical protein